MQPTRHTTFKSACSDLGVLLERMPLQELSDIRLFATGCTGFFGYWLLTALECLNRQGQAIEVVALSRNPQAFLQRHPEFRDLPWLSFVTGDVTNFRMPGGSFEAVIHGATDSSPQAGANPSLLLAGMIDGTRRVLDFLADAACQRFLLLSSGAVYGNQPASMPALNEGAGLAGDPLVSGNAYGEGKRIMEMLCACRAGKDVPAPVVARCFAFLGPHLPGHLAGTVVSQPPRRGGVDVPHLVYAAPASMAPGVGPPARPWTEEVLLAEGHELGGSASLHVDGEGRTLRGHRVLQDQGQGQGRLQHANRVREQHRFPGALPLRNDVDAPQVAALFPALNPRTKGSGRSHHLRGHGRGERAEAHPQGKGPGLEGHSFAHPSEVRNISSAGRRGRSSHGGRRSPPGPGPGRALANHSR